MVADELASLLGRLLGEGLDVFVPRHHGVVAFCAEDPRMTAVHGAGLATLEDEFVRGSLA